MLRGILIRMLLILCPVLLRAQAPLADSLLAYEYRYFKCSNDTLKQGILHHKINYYLKNGYMGEALFEEHKRLKYNLLLDAEQKKNFLWNATLVSYLNNQSEYSALYLEEYLKATADSSLNTELLKVLVYKYSDSVKVNRLIKKLSKTDKQFKDLECFAEVALYNRKHKNFYLISSLIVPGSGTAMNGRALKGLVSLALVGGSAYGVYQLVQYGLYINAVLWGSGVGLKFYSGNVKLAQKTFEEKEAQQKNKLANKCELKLKKLLTKYPLSLRGL